jgi:hypothetical protein
VSAIASHAQQQRVSFHIHSKAGLCAEVTPRTFAVAIAAASSLFPAASAEQRVSSAASLQQKYAEVSGEFKDNGKSDSQLQRALMYLSFRVVISARCGGSTSFSACADLTTACLLRLDSSFMAAEISFGVSEDTFVSVL